MTKKFLKKHFPKTSSKQPLTQGQFAGYVQRDFKIHMLIVIILFAIVMKGLIENLIYFFNAA